MIDQDLINKINSLAKKAKETGLTDSEKELQQKLRKEYINQFKNGFKGYLDNIEIVDTDKIN